MKDLPSEGQNNIQIIHDEQLLERAVRGARNSRSSASVPRWVAVRDLFCVGSTTANGLCRRFGLDPDENVRR